MRDGVCCTTARFSAFQHVQYFLNKNAQPLQLHVLQHYLTKKTFILTQKNDKIKTQKLQPYVPMDLAA